jgi:rhodanese-related sulfurtransferase
VSIDAHGDDFVEKVQAQVPETSYEIVVYCASFECQLSPEAAQKLVDAGYTKVYDFEGGLKDWAGHNYDFEGDEAEQMKAEFSDEDQDENDEEREDE